MRQPFRRASTYIALMLIIEACTGLSIIILTAIYHWILSAYLDKIEVRLLYTYLFNIYLFGIQLVVTYLCSISMWNRLWKRRCTPNVRLILSIWLFYSCVVIASGFATVWNLYYNIRVLENSAENSFYRAIDEYYASQESKLLWDSVQIRKHCCGVHSYKDWMSASWMSGKAHDSSSKTLVAPIACSKKPSNCNMSDGQIYSSLSLDSLYTTGCLSIYMDMVWRYFYILLFLILCALKFLIFLCCFTKYILQRQNSGDESDNAGLIDEEGRPLVMVKYPRNVRCVVIGEDDLASDMAPDVAYCHCDDAAGEAGDVHYN